LKPERGEILFDDERIDGLESHEVARKGIVHVPEGRRIFPELSVEENMEIGAYPAWGARK
jgi:branched-chain amino acid transport system ATP-binding protein